MKRVLQDAGGAGKGSVENILGVKVQYYKSPWKWWN